MEQFQKLIQSAAHDHDVSFRSYSGRGMFGRNCVAVTGSEYDIGQVIGEVIKLAASNIIDSAMDAESDKEREAVYKEQDKLGDLIDMIMSYEVDNMGLDKVYYWPKLQWLHEECSVDEEG